MEETTHALARIVTEQDVSQASIARAAEIPPSTMNRYMKGADMPASTAKRLAAALGVTVDELLGLVPQLTVDERELVECYRLLPSDLRRMTLDNARTLAGRDLPDNRAELRGA